MLKKILDNKAAFIIIIIVIIAAVFSIVAITSRDSEKGENKHLNTDIETQDDKENVSGETGLEIEDEVDGTVDHIDGSGSWEDTNVDSIDKDSTNATESDKSDKSNESDEMQEGDVLEDDKEWGPIS